MKRPSWKPKPYQKKGVTWLRSRPSAALFWAPGLGKTTTVMKAFQELRASHPSFKRLRMLVLAPLRVMVSVWKQEAEKWEEFHQLKIGIAHGKNKKDVMRDKSLDIVVLNYDGILWATEFIKDFGVVVYDELTRMKHTDTKRFKLWRKMLGSFLFRWGLTGTPAPNGLLDLFGQVLVLDGGKRLGQFVTKYRFNYFHQLPWDQWSWYPNSGAQQAISDKIRDVAYYIDEDDWNKMPPLMTIPIKVQLPPDAMKQYKHLEDAFILKMQEGEVIASNAGVLSAKLRQAASGMIYGEEREHLFLHDAKLEALEDLVEELAGDPVIVAVSFLHEVDAIRKRLGAELPYLGGGVGTSAADKIITKWNMGWLPVLIAHPASVAHGLNLQAGGRALIWYSLTWDLEHYLQMVRRIYRQGQTKKVFNYILTAEKTIDEYLTETLNEKNATQQRLFANLKNHYAASRK